MQNEAFELISNVPSRFKILGFHHSKVPPTSNIQYNSTIAHGYTMEDWVTEEIEKNK